MELSLKRIRKGTKSCVECRQRKIRCIWNSDTDKTCQGCTQRGRQCVPQVYARRSATSDRLSSKDRIKRLEEQIANITASIHNRSHSTASISSQGPYEPGEGKSPAETSDEADSELDQTQGPSSNPPTHLKFLFDNTLIGPDQRHGGEYVEAGSHPSCSKRYADHTRTKLARLMPSRQDVEAVSSYASPWMSIYFELFPSTSTTGSRDELVERHDEMMKPGADVVAMATFLLSFSITVRQVPEGQGILPMLQKGWKDISSYVQEVLKTVEHCIVNHTGLASTIPGISATVVWLRLQLSFGAVQTLWLTLRRVISLAELIGLPRAWYKRTSPGQDYGMIDGVADKVSLWESICATDRLASMMFNLPAATCTHHFPRKQVITSAGEILVQPYMFELTKSAMRVQELDEAYTLGQPQHEIYEKILNTDKDLRSLKSMTPVAWWREEVEYLQAKHIVQFWHCYLTARIHLHPAMHGDGGHDQYAYSRMACVESCHAMSRRYANIRRALPAGFFVVRVIDMQIFTAATFLLLSSYGRAAKNGQSTEVIAMDTSERLASVERIVTTMELAKDHVGAEFAREAAAAIRALSAHLQSAPTNGEGLTLRIPLLGKVHIGRKDNNNESESRMSEAPGAEAGTSAVRTNAGDYQIPVDAPITAQPIPTPFNPDVAEALPWLMELDMNASSLQDPFFVEDYGEFDQWMSMNPIGSV